MASLARVEADDVYDQRQRQEVEDEANMPGRCCPRYMRKFHPVTTYYWVEMLFMFISVAIIGGMYGLSKLMFPMLGHMIFKRTASTILMFIVAFGLTKGMTSAFIGVASDYTGRVNLLRLGWLLGLPVFPLIMTAKTWTQVIIANMLLGAQQGITWTLSILIMIDLTSTRDRATVIGLNEFLGFFMVAVVTLLSSIQKGNNASMDDFVITFWAGLAFTIFGLVVSIIFPETLGASHRWIELKHDKEFGREIDHEDALETDQSDGSDAELWKEHNNRVSSLAAKTSTPITPRDGGATPLDSPQAGRPRSSSRARDRASSTSANGAVQELTQAVPVRGAASPPRSPSPPASNLDLSLIVDDEPRPTIGLGNPAPLPDFTNLPLLWQIIVETFTNIWEVSTKSSHIFSAWFSGYITATKEGAVWGLSPIFFKSYNLTVEECGVLIGTYFVTLAVAKIGVGYLADRGAGKMMVIGGLFTEVFSLLYFAWAPSLLLVDLPPQKVFGLFFLNSIVLGLGHACILPTLHHAMIQHVPKERQGSTLGVFRMWLGFGLCTGAGVGGAIVEAYGFAVAFSIIAVLVVGASIVVMVMMVDLPSQHSALARKHYRAALISDGPVTSPELSSEDDASDIESSGGSEGDGGDGDSGNSGKKQRGSNGVRPRKAREGDDSGTMREESFRVDE